jgi:hypothetical protein
MDELLRRKSGKAAATLRQDRGLDVPLYAADLTSGVWIGKASKRVSGEGILGAWGGIYAIETGLAAKLAQAA